MRALRFTAPLLVTVLALGASAGDRSAHVDLSSGGSPPAGALYLAPEPIVEELEGVLRIHDYGDMVLIRLVSTDELSPAEQSRLHPVAAMDRISFRWWAGDYQPPEPGAIARLDDGLWLLPLAGPVDERWLTGLEAAGARLIGVGHPNGVVVRADGPALARALEITTSEGFRVVRGVLPLPLETRLSTSLRELARTGSPIEMRALLFVGADPDALASRLAAADHSATLGDAGTLGLRIPPADAVDLLLSEPEIGYLEPAQRIVLHNNLAAQEHVLAVEPVWVGLGFTGAGVIVAHNDTGVDLGHPDFAGAVIATNGEMADTDNGHGSHTAGSILGRGGAASPPNTSGCGDQSPPLATVRGMAWGATLATNNILDGGLAFTAEMMRWGARRGALVSSNSWGLEGNLSPVLPYTLDSVAADAAVRDADPTTGDQEPLTIFFSAGNLGPTPSTISAPQNAKNVITLGASQNDRCGAWVPDGQSGPDVDTVVTFSSRGPSQGRIKPDLVAPGSDVLSVESADPEASAPWDQSWTGDLYALGSGTSMAGPLAAGAGAVFHEFYWSSFAAQPSPALVKAALINGAVDTGLGYPSFDQGWGRLDLRRAIEGPPAGQMTFLDAAETDEMVTGQRWTTTLEVFSTAAPLKISLVWSDPPGEPESDRPLVNDLDLVVTGADGRVYRGNFFGGGWSSPDPGAVADSDNNVENVFVEVPETGQWLVEVVAAAVSQPPTGLDGQDFALVYSGDAAPCEPPPPPTGVQAAATGDNLIEVSWAPVAGATGYEVARSRQAGGRPYFPIGRVAAPATTYGDTDVSGGITYHYVVRAITGDQCRSEESEEASATATGACYLPPLFDGVRHVEDVKAVSCSLRPSWQPAVSECGADVGYDVYRGLDPEFQPGPGNLVAADVSGTSHVDPGLQEGRNHYYVVRARDRSNGAAESNTAVASGAPSGPDLVHLLEDAETGGEGWLQLPGSAVDPGTEPWTIVTWESHSPTRSWFAADEPTVKDQVLVMEEPLLLWAENLVLEFWHRYSLEDSRDGGVLEYSTDGGHSWHDIRDGDGFVVPENAQRFSEGGYEDFIVSSAHPNPLARRWAWTGASEGWTRVAVDLSDLAGTQLLLRWRIGCSAETTVGGGWWLDDIRIFAATSCQPCVAPAPPTWAAAVATDEGVALSWNPVADASEYRVHRATRAGGPYQGLASVTPPVTDYLDSAVSGGSSYHYTLTVRTDCRSDHSAERSVTAIGECTLPPTFWGLTAVSDPQLSQCGIDLSWNPAVAGCAGSSVSYRVYRSPAPFGDSDPSLLIAQGLGGTSFRDRAVAAATSYHYLVRAVDDGNGAEDANPKVIAGSAFGPDVTLFEDDIEGPADGWHTAVGSPADSGTDPWAVVDSASHSPTHSWFVEDEPVVKDQVLVLVEPIEVPEFPTAVLQFWHSFDLETFWDGGVLEYSVDDGQSWHDVLAGDGDSVPADPDRFLEGGYSGTISVASGSPLEGRRAWTGFVTGWKRVRVRLADFAGRSLLLRWRIGCDRSRARDGWWVDDVELLYTTRCATRIDVPPRRPGGRLP